MHISDVIVVTSMFNCHVQVCYIFTYRLHRIVTSKVTCIFPINSVNSIKPLSTEHILNITSTPSLVGSKSLPKVLNTIFELRTLAQKLY